MAVLPGFTSADHSQKTPSPVDLLLRDVRDEGGALHISIYTIDSAPYPTAELEID